MLEVTLAGGGVRFEAIAERTILESALSSDVSIPYSCRRGDCDACVCTLEQGSVVDKDEVKKQGALIRTCQSRPLENCTIDAEYLPELRGIERRVFPAKVSSIDVRGNVAVVKFRLPPTANVKYLEGQYVDFIYGDIRRSYSIANAVNEAGSLTFHIKRYETGRMSRLVYEKFASGTLVRMEGPLGTFFVRNGDRPIAFLATGTGFAPIQAMVERQLLSGSKRRMTIYWGNRNARDFYTNIPERWAEEYDFIDYVPLISGDKSWSGRTGYVQGAFLQDVADVRLYDIYACGSSVMINAARAALVGRGLPEQQFFSDAFHATT